MNEKIFGYDFEEIRAAQQGARLGRLVDLSKPAYDESADQLRKDIAMLRELGEEELHRRGYAGVIDRLQRAGHIKNPA